MLKGPTIVGELAALGLSSERSLTIVAKGPAIVYRVRGDDFEMGFSAKPERGSFSKMCWSNADGQKPRGPACSMTV